LEDLDGRKFVLFYQQGACKACLERVYSDLSILSSKASNFEKALPVYQIAYENYE